METQSSTLSPLSEGARRALMQLALLNSMDPRTDLYGACGPYGRVLVARGFAIPDGIDSITKLKLFKPTEAGKAEGLRLFKATATASTERAMLKQQKPLAERVADADAIGSAWLARANVLAEAGKKTQAERCYAKGQFWLDRSNKLRGCN